ncbi:MAG: glycosyltransferase [Candidatus Odinarchaeota archaeon]
MFLIRDKIFIKNFKKHKDPEEVKLEDLNHIPLVNITVPAWKNRKMFIQCLEIIRNLKYPNLKVIVNAGGSEETIRIAESYRNKKNFIILDQKPEGKMKAINDCLEYISEGILYSIDADILINDEVLIRMILPIVNSGEKVVAGLAKPYKKDENIDLVKYLVLTRNAFFDKKFQRYKKRQISGSNTTFEFDVIKTIGKFTEVGIYGASDRTRGLDVLSKGFKIYQLTDFRSSVEGAFPTKTVAFIRQNRRWLENRLTKTPYKGDKLRYLKFFLLVLLSIYVLISPFLLFINLGLFLIGIIILLSKYLKILRRYAFYIITVDKQFYLNYNYKFFFKIMLYIVAEFYSNILAFKNKVFKKKKIKL